MDRVEPINEKYYLIETEKAVNLLKYQFDSLNRAATPFDKLVMLNEILPTVDDYEQLKQLREEKKHLEFEIANCQKLKPFVDAETKEKLINNREIELERIDETLNRQYELLEAFIGELESGMLPLLKNIQRLEERKDLAHNLNKLIESQYSYIDYGGRLQFNAILGFDLNGYKSTPSRINHEKMIEAIEFLRGKRQFGVVRGLRL